jgi:Na+/H+ antiporter NhaC
LTASSGDLDSDDADEVKKLDPKEGTKFRWYNAFIPVAITLFVTFVGLIVTGYSPSTFSKEIIINNQLEEIGKAGFFGKIWESIWLVFRTDFLSIIIGNSNSYVALLWGSMMGVLSAMLLTMVTKTMKLKETVSTLMLGYKAMLPAIIILILAWSLAAVTKQLHTGDYLTSVFSGNISPEWLPFLTFIFAGVIAFSTGSSWSTMAILYPILLPLTWALGKEAGMETDAIMQIFFNVTATVLAGSVFGDHCSPISDTTVLSSLATNCNHIDHVRTQLPYAMTVGLVSIFVGGVLVMAGLPFWLNFLIGFGILYLIVRFVGKRVEDVEV